MPRQFPSESRQRALRMLEESMPEYATEYAAIRHVGARLGVGPETLRKLRCANELLRTVPAFLTGNPCRRSGSR